MPSTETILITGANGYIGQHIVAHALSQGHNVRATARSESSLAKLRATFPQHAAQLSTALVTDMTSPASYASALDKTITAIIHTASPLVLDPKDLKADVLDPAINGSVAILEAAVRYAPNASRLVVTSSLAAVADPSAGLRPGYAYTSADWNPMTYEQAAASSPVPAYVASKALAERAMWDWVAAHKPPFTLTALNPSWVYGPVIGTPNLASLNTSLAVLWSGLVDAQAVPPTDFPGFIDVRDLAAAHVNALSRPAAAGQRLLASTRSSYQTVADIVRDEFPELRGRVPEGRPGFGLTEDTYSVDGETAARVLGIEYTPLRTTVKDTFAQLLAAEKAAKTVGTA